MPNKFLIISHPRSGTHMVRSSLDSHQDIIARGELLLKNIKHRYDYGIKDANGIRLLSGLGFSGPDNKTKGFTIHRSHGNAIMWAKLKKMTDIKIIFLERSNKIEHYLSLKTARKIKVWRHNIGDDKTLHDNTKIHFDIKEFEEFVINYNKLLKRTKMYLKNHNILYVNYEKMCDNFDLEIQKILSFLEVESLKIVPQTIKSENRNLNDIVDNYEELLNYIKHNKKYLFV